MQHRTEVEAADALRHAYQQISAEIGKVIVGQQEVLKFVLISIFSNGHCLLVGVPGLAKTLLVQTVAQVLDLDFKRIQFTPDLMPSDIIGSEILGEDRNFKFIPGPVFANIILADEINRTPPKTQAALLEAMMEKSVTAAGITHRLAQPFFVLATQNPIEQEGTYPLPEAQLDRFMFNVALDYPTFQEELLVVKNTTSTQKTEVKKLLSAEQIIYFQQLVRNIPVTDNVLEYAVKLVAKTRPNGEMAAPQVKRLLNWGAGPRASQFLILGAKCHAVINGKYAPDIEDVQAIAKPILRHRIVRSYHAEAEGLSADDIIEGLF
ncbi:MoxR family ATPase [Mucilaginibacter sp.]|uniref:AAA family ATPase n=1 Tax=Mucilaginibacter sp. TaxID=1882438 RepID=UPI00283CD9BF|nr:MoxR family ATPase [Mucilaginibacter sp.]MDR3694569.1 MoxR family ATPase [Mucilaginibacter sp.]